MEVGYQVLEDVPTACLPRLAALREQLLSDPRVLAVEPED